MLWITFALPVLALFSYLTFRESKARRARRLKELNFAWSALASRHGLEFVKFGAVDGGRLYAKTPHGDLRVASDCGKYTTPRTEVSLSMNPPLQPEFVVRRLRFSEVVPGTRNDSQVLVRHHALDAIAEVYAPDAKAARTFLTKARCELLVRLFNGYSSVEMSSHFLLLGVEKTVEEESSLELLFADVEEFARVMFTDL